MDLREQSQDNSPPGLQHVFLLSLLFSCLIVSGSFVAPWTVAFQLLCTWDFASKNTRAGCHLLPQGTFPIQRLNLRLLIDKRVLYH